MYYLRLIILSLLFLLTACEDQAPQIFSQSEDYQRIEGDWLTLEEATLRQQTISNINYNLQIDLTKSARYSGRVDIQFDYRPAPFPLTIDFVGGEAELVMVNNKPIGIDYSGNFIIIPSNKLAAGTNIIKVQYSHPYSSDGSGLNRYIDPADKKIYIYSSFEPYAANKLFPSFDQPNLRATYKLKVVAPKKWTVVSSVRESEVISDGPYKRWTFPESENFSSYLFPLHAGPWHIWESKAGNTPLRLMARQSLTKTIDAHTWLRITQQGFDFYESYFNISYPYTKYDQLMVPNFKTGSLENVAAVIFKENELPIRKATVARKQEIAKTILKQLSHMWFGNLVTLDWWNDSWLKEGVASYVTPIALSKTTQYKGITQAVFVDPKQSMTNHPINMPMPDTKTVAVNFDTTGYHKGAAVIQQLALYVGENSFRKGIRTYLKNYRNKAVTLSEFLNTLESSSGMSLQQWITDWVNTAGVNTIKVDYQCIDGKISGLLIKQSADEDYPILREHQLQLALFQKNELQQIIATSVKPIRVRGEFTQLEQFSGLACPLLIYPNHGDRGYVKVQLDDQTLTRLGDNINDIAEPYVRALFWQSLWNSLLELKISLIDYLEIALKTFKQESAPEINSQLLANMNQLSVCINPAQLASTKITALLAEIAQLTPTIERHTESVIIQHEEDLQCAIINTMLATTKLQHIYLSRHAEKLEAVSDPGLTVQGKSRAQWIANYLMDKSIEVIYSTDYQRTLETAMPLAKITGKTLQIYDPTKLDSLVQELIGDGRNSFISGHSNTTPALIKLLGSDSVITMSENDYDKLYHLLISQDGAVKTEIITSLLSDN